MCFAISGPCHPPFLLEAFFHPCWQDFLSAYFRFQVNCDLRKEAFAGHSLKQVLYCCFFHHLWSSCHFLLLAVILFIFWLSNFFFSGTSFQTRVELSRKQVFMSYSYILHLHTFIWGEIRFDSGFWTQKTNSGTITTLYDSWHGKYYLDTLISYITSHFPHCIYLRRMQQSFQIPLIGEADRNTSKNNKNQQKQQ